MDNHGSTSSLNFLQARCSSWYPTNSVKAMKAHAACTRAIQIPLWTWTWEDNTHLGAMTLQSLHGLAVKSLAVHLSSSTVVLLLGIIRGAAMLMEEWQLDTAETKHITDTWTLSNCSIKQKLQTKTTTICLTALYPGQPGTRRNTHSLTHTLSLWL